MDVGCARLYGLVESGMSLIQVVVRYIVLTFDIIDLEPFLANGQYTCILVEHKSNEMFYRFYKWGKNDDENKNAENDIDVDISAHDDDNRH